MNETVKDKLKKIWHFIWHDNSIWSWIVNIILAFVIIKFLVFPGLGFILGTDFPIVAVESESMQHNYVKETTNREYSRLCGSKVLDKPKNNFDNYWEACGEWYEKRNITKQEFLTYPFKNGFNKGDIMILKGEKEVRKGDILVFKGRQKPIIHRIVETKEIVKTKGDHNADMISHPDVAEDKITPDRFLGVAIAKIPYVGWVKIIFAETLKQAGLEVK